MPGQRPCRLRSLSHPAAFSITPPDGQGGALTFQSAVPHPLARASKSLNG
jgi:hypothetical protein